MDAEILGSIPSTGIMATKLSTTEHYFCPVFVRVFTGEEESRRWRNIDAKIVKVEEEDEAVWIVSPHFSNIPIRLDASDVRLIHLPPKSK